MFPEGSPWSVAAFAFMPGGAPVVVLAGNTNNNVMGANTLKLFGLPDNTKVVLQFVGTRLNSAAGGSGAYRFRVNGVNVGQIQTYINTIRGACVLSHVVLLGPGDNTVDVSLSAVGGDETVHDTGILTALASIGT